MGRAQWKAGNILLGVSQFLVFKCSDRVWVGSADLWGTDRVGGSREGKQSAAVCPHSPFLSAWVRALCSQPQAWLRKELGRDTGIWEAPHAERVMPLALESISLLLLLLQLGAGTALSVGSWQAG